MGWERGRGITISFDAIIAEGQLYENPLAALIWGPLPLLLAANLPASTLTIVAKITEDPQAFKKATEGVTVRLGQ
jgi:hypothetical protein